MSDFSQLKQFIENQVTVTDDGCWEWGGQCFYDGTPRVYRGMVERNTDYSELQTIDHYLTFSSSTGGNRLMYVIHNGPIPPEKPYVLRTCYNSKCLNPHHLKAADRQMLELHNRRTDKDGNRLTNNWTLSRRQRAKVRDEIIDGKSFYSIARQYGLHINSVRSIANTLEGKGYVLAQRKPVG